MSNSGGIKNFTFIGGYDVSSDVISITTDHVSSESEAVEPSTCKVTLDNSGQMYGHAIVSGAFIPGKTFIQSFVVVERNVISGNSFSVDTQPYILFTGVVNNSSYNNQTATIECICISGFGAGTEKDRSWSADTLLITKFEELIADSENFVGIMVIDRTTSKDPKKASFTPSKLSLNEALRSVTTGHSKDFYFSTDESLIPAIFICDEGSYYERRDLDGFVIDPGDCTSLVGYANKVTVVAENVSNVFEKASIPDSQKKNVQYTTPDDEEEFKKYGKIEAPICYDPTIYTFNDAKIRAEALLEWYKTFEDRETKVTICDIIPLVRSIVTYMVPDVKTGSGNIQIMAGVNRKRVEYSSNGVITQLECKLLQRALAPEEPTKPKEPETPQYVYKTVQYSAFGGITFAFDKEGNFLYKASGDSDSGLQKVSDALESDSRIINSILTEDIKDAIISQAKSTWGNTWTWK
jgi:hypothetical protein